jgi:hypothetical protein
MQNSTLSDLAVHRIAIFFSLLASSFFLVYASVVIRILLLQATLLKFLRIGVRKRRRKKPEEKRKKQS